MRVCETRKRASYRSVAAVPALLWWVSLISIRGFDLTAFHKCLSPEERKTILVRIRAVNKIHPGGRRRHSPARSSPPPNHSAIRFREELPGQLSRRTTSLWEFPNNVDPRIISTRGVGLLPAYAQNFLRASVTKP